MGKKSCPQCGKKYHVKARRRTARRLTEDHLRRPGTVHLDGGMYYVHFDDR